MYLYQASAQVKALPGRPKTDQRALGSGWRRSPGRARWPAASCRRRRSAGCGRIPATGASGSRRGPRRRSGSRSFPRTRTWKLSSVISDIPGVSGRAMLRAIIAGERDPRVLAELARGRMCSKTKKLEEALDREFFHRGPRFILEMMLEEIDSTTARIAVLDEKIAVMCEPYERQVAQLDAFPGFGVTVAQDLIAGIGVDMTVFPLAEPLSSWLRTAPRREGVRGQAEGQERHRPRQPLCRRGPRRGRRQRLPVPPPSRAPSTGACASGCRRRRPSGRSCEPRS